MAKLDRPAADELELSLFGPGVGECLVLHLGSAEWMVVDSCLGSDGKTAVALEYLDGLNVDVATQVKSVLVTHWHDDHIRGCGQLLTSARSAEFICSAALDCDEFAQLVIASEEVKLVEDTSGLQEFSRILSILQNRNADKFAVGPAHWACDGLLLFNRAHPKVQVYARSPSAQSITDSKGELARELPKENQPIRRFHTAGPNDRSVVLLIVTERLSVLLGADLEKGEGRRGWRGVLASAGKYGAKGHVFKVAHHGSCSADCEEIWSTLLEANPLSVLTPYARGSKPLPSKDDVARIKSKTSRVYCALYPPTRSPPRKHSAVERTMREVAKTRRAISRKPGHIRMRVPLSGTSADIRVELFDGAQRL